MDAVIGSEIPLPSLPTPDPSPWNPIFASILEPNPLVCASKAPNPVAGADDFPVSSFFPPLRLNRAKLALRRERRPSQAPVAALDLLARRRPVAVAVGSGLGGVQESLRRSHVGIRGGQLSLNLGGVHGPPHLSPALYSLSLIGINSFKSWMRSFSL